MKSYATILLQVTGHVLFIYFEPRQPSYQTTVFHGGTPNQVQRRLQIRIEAQSKYLQSILDKACRALDDEAVASAGLEAARKELSDLAIKVAHDCNGVLLSNASEETDRSSSIPYMPARLGDCSMDSGVMSHGSPISPSTFESQAAAALKKRSRESIPLDSSMRPVEWMMSNFG